MDEQREAAPWNERHGGLFEPDVVLPAQFFRTLRGREAQGGERRLIIAVLEDAVNCFQKNLFARDNRGRRLFRESEKWMMSADRSLPFSFENICDFLSIDAEYIRQGLRRWADLAQLTRPADSNLGALHRGAAAPIAAAATRAPMAPGVDRTRASFKRPLHSSAVG